MAMAACGAGEIGMSPRKKKRDNSLYYRIVANSHQGVVARWVKKISPDSFQSTLLTD